MESLLHVVAGYVALALQAVAIVIVAFGSARALVSIARAAFASHPGASEQRAEWLDYARWLVVVAVVRTFLSYFLDREMEHAAKLRAESRTEIRADASPSGD